MKSTRFSLRALTIVFALVGFSLLLSPQSIFAAENTTSAEVDLEKIFAGAPPQTVADLRAMEEHVRKLAEKVVPCTVGVQVGPAQGSGVIISKDGYVLTAGHVVGRPNQNVTFIFPDGKKVRGKTLGLNRGIDSGLMKITDEGEWPHVEMGDSSDLGVGQWCLATGHPGGYQSDRQPVLRLGRILSSRDSVIVTDCPLIGGDSGGPLFDMQGQVIGIHSRIGGPLTANLHVPVKTYSDTWDRLVKAESWGRFVGDGGPYIGVRGDGDADIANITEVQPDSPAEAAGVKVGDVIKKFDGEDVTDFASLVDLVQTKEPGDKVKIIVLRDEELVELNLVVGKRGE